MSDFSYEIMPDSLDSVDSAFYEMGKGFKKFSGRWKYVSSCILIYVRTTYTVSENALKMGSYFNQKDFFVSQIMPILDWVLLGQNFY